MISYYLAHELARINQKEHLEAAQRARLVKEVEVGRPRLRKRLVSSGGDLLIFVGQKIKEHYGPKIQPRPTGQRSIPEGMPRDC
jgi:hypothetical protein